MSKIVFSERAWSEYVYWQTQDKKTLHRINQLLKDIERNGNSGIGKAEPLKYQDGVNGLMRKIVWSIILKKV